MRCKKCSLTIFNYHCQWQRQQTAAALNLCAKVASVRCGVAAWHCNCYSLSSGAGAEASSFGAGIEIEAAAGAGASRRHANQLHITAPVGNRRRVVGD